MLTAWYPNGQKYVEMPFVLNSRQGLTTVWNENGTKRCTLRFIADKAEGDYEARYPNGTLWEKGAFHDGLPDGPWRIWNNEGTHLATLSFRNGTITSTRFEPGLRSGSVLDIFESGPMPSGFDAGRGITSWRWPTSGLFGVDPKRILLEGPPTTVGRAERSDKMKSPRYQKGYARGCQKAKMNIEALKRTPGVSEALMKMFSKDLRFLLNNRQSLVENAGPDDPNVQNRMDLLMGYWKPTTRNGIVISSDP